MQKSRSKKKQRAAASARLSHDTTARRGKPTQWSRLFRQPAQDFTPLTVSFV